MCLDSKIRLRFLAVALLSAMGPAPRAAADAHSSLVLSLNPVAYWRMDETGGVAAIDAIRGFTAAYDHTPAFGQPGGVEGSPNPATRITANNWARGPVDGRLNPASAFTISLLAKVDVQDNRWKTAVSTLHNPGGGVNRAGFWIARHPNRRWYFYTGADRRYRAISGGYNVVGRWDHVAVTWQADGGTDANGVPTGAMKLYVNGALVAQSTTGAYLANAANPFDIGVAAHRPSMQPRTNTDFSGDLDEIALFDKRLSDAEVRELAKSALGTTGTTYYVRRKGRDTNDGLTPATAFESFTVAAQHCRAGDTVYVGAGKYEVDRSFRNWSTGFDTAPIRYIGDTTGARTGDKGRIVISAKKNKGKPAYYPFYAYDVSDLHFSGLEFEDGVAGLWFRNCDRIVIDSCEFSKCRYGYRHDGGSVALSNCHIHDNLDHGMLNYRSQVVVNDTLIEKHRRYGFYLYDNPDPNNPVGATATLNRVVLRNMQNYAVVVHRSEFVATDCTLEKNRRGFYLNDDFSEGNANATAVITGLTATQMDSYCLASNGYDVTLDTATLDSNTRALYFVDRRKAWEGRPIVQVSNVAITNTGWYAAYAARVNLTLTDSQLADNSGGIYLVEDATPQGTGATALIDRVSIRRSSRWWGIVNYRYDLDLRNSLVADNARGIYVRQMDAGSQAWHVTSVNNAAHGFYQYQGECDVYNCLITGTASGYGLGNVGGRMNNDYNLVAGNNRNYVSVTPGAHAVYGLPYFTGDEDYHLVDSSPGVNAGTDPGTRAPYDLEKQPRGKSGGWTLGCYASTVAGWAYDNLVHAYSSNNPVSWWRLGERVGETIAVDSVGGNHGTYVGPVGRAQVSPVSEDGAARFSSVNEYVLVPHSDAYLLDQGTLLMWYRADEASDSWAGVFSKDGPGFGTGGQTSVFAYKPLNAAPYVFHQTVDRYLTLTSSEPGTFGEWTFLAYSFGPNGATLLVNGELVRRYASNPEGWGTSSGGAGNFEPIFIGGTSWLRQGTPDPLWKFSGWIDEVAIFDRQLAPEEVARIYAASRNPKENPTEMQIPPLWAVTGNDGRLVRIDDYTALGSTTTDFGQIHYKDGGATVPIGAGLRSLAITSSSRAYLLCQQSLGSHPQPVLMRLNLQDVQAGEVPVAVPMATLGVIGGVNAIAYDASSNAFYALGVRRSSLHVQSGRRHDRHRLRSDFQCDARPHGPEWPEPVLRSFRRTLCARRIRSPRVPGRQAVRADQGPRGRQPRRRT